MTEWQDKTWGDLATLEYGKALAGYEENNGRYRVFGTNGPIGLCDKPLCPHPTVIVGRKGAYRGVHHSPEPCFVIDTAFYMKPKIKLDMRWAYYQLLTQDINGMDSGSAIPSTSRDDFYMLPVRLPPLPEQRAIAGVLGALDDKIELNRRMNETLEVLAQTLFQEWFGDVEPSVPLPELIEVNPGRPLRNGEVAPYLDMANMPTHSARALEVYDRKFGSGMRFVDGDTLVARITPCLENGKTCFVDFLGDGKVGWGSTEYIVLRPKPPLPEEYAYFLARTEDFRAFAISNMTGTSGRQRVPADCLEHFQIATPPEELVQRFGHFASAVFGNMKANDVESRTLAALRDTLLPKLLSGEVRVKMEIRTGDD